ncbi:DUF4864 domain-containing protein [Devosia nitrariae]|uniref:DUF4864 domain-containing protein n=1 Tax=Devosia nitrariae TaxID=2071872 RepID=A0ABQ5VYG1_9HYPH|nr:DUF4864 domain-containing protein [Devosia nitrariae]GLQ52813.1 DUF4864 domain-containing protein [Devosia nitrariae]
MRFIAVVVLTVLSLMPNLSSGQERPAAPWQAAISSQIEAFRAQDGAGALAVASAGFRAQFSDPQLFYEAILAAGYGPIMDSRSHTFGEFERVGADSAVQIVLVVGPDQGLYEALYEMRQETDGWRVFGVALRREEGVAI